MSKPHIGSPGRRNCFGDAPATASRRKTAAVEPDTSIRRGAMLRRS